MTDRFARNPDSPSGIFTPGSSAENARACAHESHGLAIERLVRRTRCPIDRILQHAWNGIVVFGRHDEESIGRANPRTKSFDRSWKALGIDIVVVKRDVPDLEGLDAQAAWRKALRGTQKPAVVGALAQAAGNSQDSELLGGIHCSHSKGKPPIVILPSTT